MRRRGWTVLSLLVTVAASGAYLELGCGRVVDPPRDGATDAPARDQGTDRTSTVEARPSEMSDAMACPTECLREIVCCRSDCTGPAVNRGCCECAAGEIDSLSCPAALSCAPRL